MGQQHVEFVAPCYRTMDLDITLSHDVFQFPSPSYPVTKPIIEDGYQWLDDVKKLLEKDNLEDVLLCCEPYQH